MDLEKYKKLLKEHDWYYQYSDDHSVWRAGSHSHNVLWHFAKQSPEHLKAYQDMRKLHS
jgi:hypothetical protein